MGTVLNMALPYFVRYRCKNVIKPSTKKIHSISRDYRNTLCHWTTSCHCAPADISYHWLIYFILLAAACPSVSSASFPLFLKSRVSQLLDNLKKVRALCCHDILQWHLYIKTRLLSTINQFETLATKRCVNYNLSK